MTTREEMLRRVRDACAGLEPVAHPGELTSAAPPHDRVERFAERLAELAGEQILLRPEDAGEAERMIAGRLAGVPSSEILAPGGAPCEHRDHAVGLAVAVAACAASGTVILDLGDAEAGVASLLVEESIVCVPEDVLVDDILAWTRSEGAEARSHHVVAICGASRTADIEKTLVSPAHGPARLVVVLLPRGVAPPPQFGGGSRG
jgi:L-lactate utilization protein LutC